MSNEIIKVIDSLADKVGLSIDWTAENIMPYLQELMTKYVKYTVINSSFVVIVCILVIVGFIVCQIKYLKNRRNIHWNEKIEFVTLYITQGLRKEDNLIKGEIWIQESF